MFIHPYCSLFLRLKALGMKDTFEMWSYFCSQSSKIRAIGYRDLLSKQPTTLKKEASFNLRFTNETKYCIPTYNLSTIHGIRMNYLLYLFNITYIYDRDIYTYMYYKYPISIIHLVHVHTFKGNKYIHNITLRHVVLPFQNWLEYLNNEWCVILLFHTLWPTGIYATYIAICETY